MNRKEAEIYCKFAEMLNIDHPMSSISYNNMASSTKRQKISYGRKFLDFIARVIAPHGEKDFIQKLCKVQVDAAWGEQASNKYTDLLENIAERYGICPNKRDKKLVLSILAPFMSEIALRQYIPDLSHSQFTSARKVPKETEHEPHKRAKFDARKINLFIWFITR